MDKTEIAAGRLQLRPWQPGDAPALQRVLDDPAVARWTPHPAPYTVDRAERRIAEDDVLWAAGGRAELAVLDATSAELLGVVGLYRVTATDAEVGWLTAAAARGHGTAAEAVSALCRWGFGALGLQRLAAVVEVGNLASLRVAQKAAFTLDGVGRGLFQAAAGRADGWLLSRLPADPDQDTAPFPAHAERTDGVVRLRRWRLDDAAEVARACEDPETARWLPVPSPYRLSDGQAYVREMTARSWLEGTVAAVAVTDAASGALLGACALTVRDRALGHAELGYWTAPWARGRGVAGRAAALHTGWAIEVLGLARVELLAEVDNIASQRAAERAGFVREGVARSVRPRPRSTERTDMVVFAKLA